ncbi:hypothetical protein [Halosegnis longus]|uniref:hypothetical protein n=1 Tax=Halosegnis longus TaxID=2216012 RepID=UPI00096A4AEE|nr:hypothetical protein [Salella cibi]
MSRRAAESGFELFLDPTMTAVRREFSVERALRGTGFGLGGRVVDRLRENNDAIERQLVAGEFDAYRERSLAQFRVLLDAVESDEEIEPFADELLAHDSYVEAVDETATPAQRAAVEEDVLSRLERLGTGLEPVLDRPEDDFWAAANAAYSREAATTLVQEAFPFTEPLSTHRDVLIFEVEADPNELLDSALLPTLPTASIDYTDEAIHAMTRAERQVVADLTDEVRSRFGAEEE